MEITVSQQSTVFLYCILCGALLGIAFDLFRIFRRLVPTGRTATDLQDILYWVIASLVAFSFVMQCNAGEIRWYMLLGILLGAGFYFVAISVFLLRISVAVIRLMQRIILRIIRIITTPIRLILHWMKKPFFLVIRIGRSGGKRAYSKFQENLMFFRKFLKKV